jgi:hypothetical protein
VARAFEYGMLQQLGREFRFFSNAKKGGLPMNAPVYRALNDLAREGWEPLFFYHEGGDEGELTPTWVMRLDEEGR